VTETAATYALTAIRQQVEVWRKLSGVSWRAAIITSEVRDVAPEDAQAKARAACDELAAMIARVRESIAT
jgi:hypothetical protein